MTYNHPCGGKAFASYGRVNVWAIITVLTRHMDQYIDTQTLLYIFFFYAYLF